MHRRAVFWIFLCLSAAVAFFCVAYPMYVIWPFRMQRPRELATALDVLQHRSFITGVCVGLGLVMWFAIVTIQRRWLPRIGATIVMVLTGACAYLAHVNIYELMFHPMGRPSFEAAGASKLNGAEEVLAVNVNGVARAYPIRSMSYHHIVNDTVSGVPIVATY